MRVTECEGGWEYQSEGELSGEARRSLVIVFLCFYLYLYLYVCFCFPQTRVQMQTLASSILSSVRTTARSACAWPYPTQPPSTPSGGLSTSPQGIWVWKWAG